MLMNPQTLSPTARRRSMATDATAGQGMPPGGAPGTPQPASPATMPPAPGPGTPSPWTPSPVSPPMMPGLFTPPTGRPGHAQPLNPGGLGGAMSPMPPAPPPLPVAPPTLSGGAGTPGAPPLPDPGGAAPTTPIDPTNDLRSRAVLPTNDTAMRDELSSYFGGTDVAKGAGVAPAPSARALRMGGLVDSAAGTLGSIDRVQMAKDLLSQFDEQQVPEHELALRKATEKWLGRGGGRSGMLRTDYGNEDLTRLRDRDQFKKGIMGDALQGSIADQFAKTSALSGLEDKVTANDANARGEQRTERAYDTGIDEGNVNRRLSTREAVNNIASTTGARNRAEVRGERTNQNDMEQRSFERMLGQDNYQQNDIDRRQQRALQLLGAGEAGNPSSILAALSASGGMDPQLIASLAQLLGRGTAGATSTTIPVGRTLPASEGSPV